MSGWKTLSSDIVYATAWFKVRRDKVINHNNKQITYSVLELHHPSVIIVAMDDEGRILMQRQYRYTLDKTIWELPAGHSDGQDLLVAAKRELLEETGLVSEDWTPLGFLNEAVGVANISCQIFLAKDVLPASSQHFLDEDEQITHQEFMSVAKLEKLALSGELVDAQAMSALYLMKLQKAEVTV